MLINDHASISFAADSAQLASVRDFAQNQATAFGTGVDLALLAVIVGELAANATVHQGGEARLDLDVLSDGSLEVSVSDHSPGRPRLVQDEPWSTDGHRGIQLVAALADSWGVAELHPGKRVWARLAPEDEHPG